MASKQQITSQPTCTGDMKLPMYLVVIIEAPFAKIFHQLVLEIV